MENEKIVVEEAKPQKPKKALFIVSLVFSIISFVLIGLSVLFFFLAFKIAGEMGEAETILTLGLPVILVLALSFLVGIISTIFGAVALGNAIPCLKKEKSARGIVMTIITSCEILYLGIWVLMLIFR